MTDAERAIGCCECGCGGRTRISLKSSTRQNYVAGQPRRFLVGHQSKTRGITGNRYRRPGKGGQRKGAHVLAAECALGKPLPARAEVHHVNGVKHDNRPGNLVVCPDRAYHKLLHIRQAALSACGHANWRKCPYCQQYDAPGNLRFCYTRAPFHGRVYHLACKRVRELARYHRLRTEAI